MCIDAETSLASFIIGEATGLLLILSGKKEKQAIGLYIMFYSFIQLFEYNIYNNNNISLNSNLIIINLAIQGLLFFIAMKNVCEINNNYIYISLFIILCTFFIMIYTKQNDAKIEKCIKWTFLHNEYKILFSLMYMSMFYLLFFDKCGQNNNFLNKTGWFFVITYIFSIIIGILSDKALSFWCLLSAVAAPILLFVN